jgi:hypothetical protein
MINDDDLNNAENNIDDLFKIRDELISSSPYLTDMKSRIQWYKKAIFEIPDQKDILFSLIESPVSSILLLTPTNLDFGSVTGATGSFYSVSGDTRQIVTAYGKEHYHLMTEYDNLKKTETLIDEIAKIIFEFRKDLQIYKPHKLLFDAKTALLLPIF